MPRPTSKPIYFLVLQSDLSQMVIRQKFPILMIEDGKLLLFILMSVCPFLSDIRLHFGSARTVQSRNVSLLFGFSLHLLFGRSLFQFATFKGNADGHSLRNFVVGCFTIDGHSQKSDKSMPPHRVGRRHRDGRMNGN